MGNNGCAGDGSLDVSKFNKPMPWIGLYIAAASAACAIGMAVDATHGIRYRKLWFPSKFFTLNATTLTLVAVATKLSVDLNTSMPRPQDQLAKLSSTALVCTVMANFMPSLGTTPDNSELLANLVALGIFVVTVMVNICIELGTGVIYVFWWENAVILVVMFILLALKISSALTIPPTKKFFEIKLKLAVNECNDIDSNSDGKRQKVSDRLQKDLTKYWMMAHTCNPQFVLARLTTCNASGAFCLVSTAALVEATIRCFFLPWQFKFCGGESDYKWSITPILIAQAMAIGIGTLAPASRYFATINFISCPEEAKKVCKKKFQVEKYWTAILVLMKESQSEWSFHSRLGRKLAHNVKDKTLDLCIYAQIGVVWLSKLVQLLSLMLIIQILLGYQTLSRLILRCVKFNSKSHCGSESEPKPGTEAEPESKPHPMQELSRFVLHMEGEEEVIDMMMQRSSDATEHWFRMGTMHPPNHVIRFLKEKLNSTSSSANEYFEGVNQFDSGLVQSLDNDEPPNCWALPVVTLTSIALTLPNVELVRKEQLIQSAHEALVYIRFIEDKLDTRRELINVRNAAAFIWTGVDLYFKWLDVDLLRHFQHSRSTSPREIFELLADAAKERFKVFRENDQLHCLRENASDWPVKVLAANSMYRICQTLLVRSNRSDCNSNYNYYDWESGKLVFDKLSVMIAQIIGACFTNLKYVISEQCLHCSIEKREDRTRHSITLLGETEQILEILENKKLDPSYKLPEQSLHIDEWRSLNQHKHLLRSATSLTIDIDTPNSAVSSSPDLYLEID